MLFTSNSGALHVWDASLWINRGLVEMFCFVSGETRENPSVSSKESELLASDY